MTNFERAVAREANTVTRVQVIESIEQGKLTTQQGADVLGVTARQMRRMKAAYRTRGSDGVKDGRTGPRPGRRVSEVTKEKVLRLRRDRYGKFNVRHLHEHLVEKHELTLSYSWTLRMLQAEGLVEKRRRRGTYRRRRPRQPMRGMRIHLDGSTHPWLGADKPHWDLITVLDDADGEMLYSQFVEEEGTLSTFAALHSVLTKHGRFVELYVDRGSHFCHIDAETGESLQTTQVARALKTLGMRMINAKSPQARGRGERGFGTIQGRLPQELELHGITDYAAANRYIDEVFKPDFNKRFTVQPQESHSMFSAVPPCDLHLIFSIHEERKLRNDYTVQFQNKCLQLPNSENRPSPRQKVIVHRFFDGSLGISYRDRLLACYQTDGTPILSQPPTERPRPTQPTPTPADLQNHRKPGPGQKDFFDFLNAQMVDKKGKTQTKHISETASRRHDLFV